MPKPKQRGHKPKKDRTLTKRDVNTIVEGTVILVANALQAHWGWTDEMVQALAAQVGQQLAKNLQPEATILKALGMDGEAGETNV